MVCDRIIIINRGKIVADEKTEDIEKAVIGSRQIQLKICGPAKEVQTAIKALSGIKYAEVIGERELQSTAFLVESEPGLDMRRAIFNLCASHAWPIIGMEAVGLNLEDIFISVVDEQEAETKKKKQKVRK